jgi:hypothetical protein
MNNAVFGTFLLLFIGKTMENMRKRIKMELIYSERRKQKLINQPMFKYTISCNENLCTVSLDNKMIEFCKPIYIGIYIFSVSKL